MKPGTRALVAVLAALAIGLASFASGVVAGREQGTDMLGVEVDGTGLSAIRDAYNKILSNAVDPPSADDLARAAVRAMIRVLKESGDPYAVFYTPRAYRDVQELTTGQFSGIGVWLKVREERLEIVSVLPSSPARDAGLRRGDVILSVDGEPIDAESQGLIDDAVNRIKGPEGTEVTLGIERLEQSLTFTITRETLDLPNLRAHLTDEGFGYVRLFGFALGAGEQVRTEVEQQIEAGATGIVLDMRGNGGGLFAEAIEVASVFIEDGEITTYVEGSQEPQVENARGDAFEDVPLVVLVDAGTASASEIVAGALQDHERAILVGTQTYGKNTVQDVVPLLDSSAIKLTIGEYLTPNGKEIGDEGIEPDVEVASMRDQRRRAFEILRGIALSAG